MLEFLNSIWADTICAGLFIAAVFWRVKHLPKRGERRRLFSSAFSARVSDWKLDIVLPAALAAVLSALFFLRGGFTGNPLLASPIGIAYSVGIAPIWEEILFRGMLVGLPLFWRKPPIAKRLGMPWWLWAALLVTASSWLFMQLHWIASLDVFVSALLYGTLYVWRKSLVPAVIAHSIGNFTLLVLAMALA